MFEIKIRITEDAETLKNMPIEVFDKEIMNINGFVEVSVNNCKEGCYYHENPLQEGEEGLELVNWWLELFLIAASYIKSGKYIAFLEPETYNRWFEFERIKDNIIIRIALAEHSARNDVIVYKKNKRFKYIECLNITFEEFNNEIKHKTKMFLDELNKITPNLLKTKMSKDIIKYFENLQ